MVADLDRRHRLVGGHHAAVEALLGPGGCDVSYEDEPCLAPPEFARVREPFAFARIGTGPPARIPPGCAGMASRVRRR